MKWFKKKIWNFLWRIWKWKEKKGRKKILTFRSGDLNTRFSVIFPPMIWIFMWSEEPEIKSKQSSKIDRTLKTDCLGVQGAWVSLNGRFCFHEKVSFLWKFVMRLQIFFHAIVLKSNDACLCSSRHDLWIFLLLSQTLDCCKKIISCRV